MARMIPFVIIQMVSAHCISEWHMLKKDLQDENFKNLSKTTRRRALLFGVQHDLVDLYQIC